jgi:hypothetical protein
VISVASAIGTNTARPKYSAVITNAKSRSAQIPFSATAGLSGKGRVRMRQAFSRLQPGLSEPAIATSHNCVKPPILMELFFLSSRRKRR